MTRNEHAYEKGSTTVIIPKETKEFIWAMIALAASIGFAFYMIGSYEGGKIEGVYEQRP